jgi:ferredoxin
VTWRRFVSLPEEKIVTVADGTNLLEAARKAGVFIAAPCDGSGTCGKCRVKIPAEHNAENFKEAPHELLTPAERADGWALACQSTIHGDLQAEPDQCADDDLKILSEGRAVCVELDSWITKTFDAFHRTNDCERGRRVSGNRAGRYDEGTVRRGGGHRHNHAGGGADRFARRTRAFRGVEPESAGDDTLRTCCPASNSARSRTGCNCCKAN